LDPSNRRSIRPVARGLLLLAVIQFLASVLQSWRMDPEIPQYLPIHTLLETVSILVSGMVFAVGWNSHQSRFSPNHRFLACVFLCVAVLDFSHMASYVGMPDFVSPNDPQKSLAFWLVARLLAAAGLLIGTMGTFGTVTAGRRTHYLLAAGVTATAGIEWLVLCHPEWLPISFLPGIGLTTFKKVTEYAVIALNLLAAGRLLARLRAPQPRSEVLLLGAVCTLAMSEFFFTFYSTMTGTYNLLGHVYKVIGYVFIYRAVVTTAIDEPYRLLEKAKTKFSDIFDSVNDGIELIAADGTIVEVNRTAAERLGYGRQELAGMCIADLCNLDDAALWVQRCEHLSRHGRFTFESSRIRRDGGVITVEVSARMVEVDDQELILGISRDITDRKAAELLLLKESARNQALLRSASDGTHILGADGVLIEASDAFCAMLGYAREELLGMRIAHWDAGLTEAALDEAVARLVAQGGRSQFETVHRRRDGSVFDVEVSSFTLELDGHKVLVCSSRDITERREAQRHIENLAYYDAVTRLPNRRLMRDRLLEALAAIAQSGKNGALLLIDLDHFKDVNDTLGHEAGDQLLRSVGERLTQCLRKGDSVARLGGDEFVVILNNLGELGVDAAAQVAAVASKILSALDRADQVGGHRYRNSASIGATLLDQRCTPEDVLRQADVAMYQAKRAGRNGMRLFDPTMQDGIDHRAALEGALQLAIDEGQLLLHYQVQVDAALCPTGVEALIRWAHPQQGLLLPAQFLPVADESALTLPIGYWVVEGACAQLGAWRRDPLTRGLTVSVNVSPRQLGAPDFAARIAQAVQRHAIDPALLILEPTERLFLRGTEGAIATLTALRATGVRCSLDDFGTGCSSVRDLQRMPLYQLKIDQSFVRDLFDDPGAQVIVRTIIAMAVSLGLETIAEGVETQAQLDLLRALGCGGFQGHLFGRPAPAARIVALLRADAVLTSP